MDKVIEFILVLVIIGGALAFGGVRPIAYSLGAVVLFLLVLLLLLQQAKLGRISLPLPAWPVLFVLLVILQVLPLPAWLVASLSPFRLLDPANTGYAQGKQLWTTLSVYPHDTLLALVKFLSCLSAFVLAAHLFDSRKSKSNLIRGLILLGCFEAGYGIIQYLTGWQKIFTYTKQYNLQEATGTYINRNHFAGLLELTLPFVLALVFYYFQLWLESRRASRGRHGGGSSSAGNRAIFYFFLLTIMVVAVIFSRSRMGILAAVFSIIFVGLLAQLKTRRKVWMLGLFAFLICVMGYGLWIGLDPVLARFEQMREPGYVQMEGRIAFWKDTLRLTRDYPVLGSGLGTFGTVFQRYQTSRVDRYVSHAHNDYLEFASETGLIGVALLFLPIFYLLLRMVGSFLDDPRRYRRAVTLGCIGSTLALLIHSITDFNLQIPANALVFAVVLGIGCKATCVERRGEEQNSLRPREQRTVEERSGFHPQRTVHPCQ